MRRTGLLLLLVGCGDAADIGGSQIEAVAPHVVALSTYRASVGTMIEAYGENFSSSAEGRTALVFRGTFEGQDGQREDTEFVAPVRRIDRGTVRWSSFGPYQNPFSRNGQVGRFVGTVAAQTTTSDGRLLEDPRPTSIELEVMPSVLVHDIQPVTAQCSGPALRGLGGAAYRLQVQAVGFEPESFTYSVAAPSVLRNPLQVRRLAQSNLDTLGERGDFILPQVPGDMPSYGAIVTIEGRAKDGKSYQNAFAFTVHRPLEVFYNGNVEVAEVLAPVPVSGCIPGGISGRSVEYSESTSESRSRGYNVNWNQGWVSAHSVEQGSSQTVGLSESNGVGFSTSDGRSFNWSLGAEVSGTFGLDALVSLGVSTSIESGGAVEQNQSQNTSRETGVNSSSTTTETESISTENSSSRGAGIAWEVSSSQQIGRSFSGDVIAGTYGVFYRQALRLVRRAAVVAYNQCGQAQVVAELDFTDWTWSPDLAIGSSCPPLPASNLPAAQCLVPPCLGE